MAQRKGISKKMRFEVFKRDLFTCHYCSRKAPEVLLEVDHIRPVSKGGSNDMLNLITSCRDCNIGKGKRELGDMSVFEAQRKQLETLQERKEQIEMMFRWQKGLMKLEDKVTDKLSAFWTDRVVGYSLNEAGLKSLRKLTKKFTIAEIFEAIKIATDQYIMHDENNVASKESAEIAWSKVPGICYNRRYTEQHPEMNKLLYVRGILRNRLRYIDERRAIKMLGEAYKAGASLDSLEFFAKEVDDWTEFRLAIEEFMQAEDSTEYIERRPEEMELVNSNENLNPE